MQEKFELDKVHLIGALLDPCVRNLSYLERSEKLMTVSTVRGADGERKKLTLPTRSTCRQAMLDAMREVDLTGSASGQSSRNGTATTTSQASQRPPKRPRMEEERAHREFALFGYSAHTEQEDNVDLFAEESPEQELDRY